MHQFAGIFGPVRLLVIAAAAAGLGACRESRPEPDLQEEGALEAPTHEQDALRRAEERQERNRGGGGGGGSY
jgi:hypothetical protein